MMKGQVRAAVRWIMDRTSKGDVLDASACTESGSKTVFDVLKEKHPDPSHHLHIPFYHTVSLTVANPGGGAQTIFTINFHHIWSY